MLPSDDGARVRHMLDAARQAVRFAQGIDRAGLDVDTKTTFAVVRALEIIGEAASKVSPAGRHLAPSLPWSRIVGMRNRVIHAYFEVDLDMVWDTLTHDLPGLIAELERVLGEHDDASQPGS